VQQHSHPAFEAIFPFLELPVISGRVLFSIRLSFANFFPLEKRGLSLFEKRPGAKLALLMHKEKDASESHRDDLAVNNLNTNQSETYGKHNNILSVRGPVNENSQT